MLHIIQSYRMSTIHSLFYLKVYFIEESPVTCLVTDINIKFHSRRGYKQLLKEEGC